VNNLINNAASDMSVHWNKTNRAFTDRISETQDAHRNLKSNLILTKNVSRKRPPILYSTSVQQQQHSWDIQYTGISRSVLLHCTYLYINSCSF
jgi:hypothetical protein